MNLVGLIPGLNDLVSFSDNVSENMAPVVMNRSNPEEAVRYMSRLPKVMIVACPGGAGFGLEFRARGRMFNLRGTIQGNRRVTWANYTADGKKWASTYPEVAIPGGTKLPGKINAETLLLVYKDVGTYDTSEEVAALEVERSRLVQVAESHISTLSAMQFPETQLQNALERILGLYQGYKRDYLETTSSYHVDKQMAHLREFESLMDSSFMNHDMFIEPLEYRETHPDAPMVFVNPDRSCFLNAAVQMLFSLPDNVLTASVKSGPDQRIRARLRKLILQKRAGSAVESLHDLRVALGDAYMWFESNIVNVISDMRRELPALGRQSEIFDWRHLRGKMVDQLVRTHVSSSQQLPPVIFVTVPRGSEMGNALSFNTSRGTYELVAVGNYFEDPTRGNHSTSNVRTASAATPGDFKWFNLDNHVACEISPAEVVGPAAEMLMYVLKA
jgi:hypothetical protein